MDLKWPQGTPLEIITQKQAKKIARIKINPLIAKHNNFWREISKTLFPGHFGSILTQKQAKYFIQGIFCYRNFHSF